MGAQTAILAFALFIIGTSFAIGWWARKKVTSPEAFFGGAKIFGPLVIGLSTMAAVGSAFAVVGVPGLVYSSGNTILLFMLASPGFAFGYLVIGKKVRAMAELGPVASLGDISDLRFNRHRGIKLSLSVMLFLGCIMYLSAQIQACSQLFGHLLGWEPWLAGLVIFGILIVYTVLSGEVGGILTQAFQGLVMVIAGVTITVAFFLLTDGFGPVLDVLSRPNPGVETTAVPGMLSAGGLDAWGELPGSIALAWVLLPTLGIMCQPQVLTRMFALREPRDMPRLAVYATLANMVVGFMVMTIGYCAIYLVGSEVVPPLERADSAVFVVADYLGVAAQLLVYAAVLAAAMSTSSLFLSLAGSVISRDVPSALGKKLAARSQIRIARVTMSALGLLSIGLAATSGKMVAILGTYGFGTLMVATFPIFIIGLLWKDASSQGVFAGLTFSLLATIACILLERTGFSWPGHVPWYMNVLSVSVLITVAVSLFTRGATRSDLDPRVACAIDL